MKDVAATPRNPVLLNRRMTLAASVAAALSPWASPARAMDALRVGGTGGASALMAHVGSVFTQRTGIAVEVVLGFGTGGALKALAEGVLDLTVSGRPLNPTEQAKGLAQVATVRTPYVLATSHPAPPGLSGREVVAAYSAGRAVWPDGTPLRILLRPRSDSDAPMMAALFLGMEAALNQARQRGDAPVATTDQDNVEQAEKLPGSLGGATYTQVVMERRNLRLVALDGVTPTPAAYESGPIRMARSFA